jgi:GrpB-like predicted nucleotidyltransferase (UPF0157 family)
MVRKVIVLPHDPAWSAAFQIEASALRDLWRGEVVRIHHIGSTAIPGICAKPIIDILVEVRDIARIEAFDEGMIRRGYVPEGENGIPGRRFYTRGSKEARTHHVHVYQVGSAEIERHIVFRDFMIAHPQVASAYGRIKAQLAERFPEDIDSYVEGKDAFVKEMERRAMAWKEAHDRDRP